MSDCDGSGDVSDGLTNEQIAKTHLSRARRYMERDDRLAALGATERAIGAIHRALDELEEVNDG